MIQPVIFPKANTGRRLSLNSDELQFFDVFGFIVLKQFFSESEVERIHKEIEKAKAVTFSDQSFDMVILSQTLQQVNAPLDLIRSMLRIGKKVIVTFPNFAHWTIRLSLLFGYIPKSKSLPYEWYNTPNIRVISIHSFKKMCKKNNIRIVEEISLFAPGLINTLFSKGFPNYF